MPESWNYVLEAYFWIILILLIYATYQVINTTINNRNKLKEKKLNEQKSQNKSETRHEIDSLDVYTGKSSELFNIDQVMYIIIFLYNIILLYSDEVIKEKKIYLYSILILFIIINFLVIYKYIISPNIIEKRVKNAYGKIISRITGLNTINIRKRLQIVTIFWIISINFLIFSGFLFDDKNETFVPISIVLTIYAFITLISYHLNIYEN
tara:strand:- start:157 stop:783 length:627 start_codon:yes stop_codon:yes gene_type:complete